jgi:SAM-dependent methyltransferase
MPRTKFNDDRSHRIDPDFLAVCHRDHLERYELARFYAAGKRVLDIGCGIGYGSDLLADAARQVDAVDLYAPGIAYAQEHYRRPNLLYRVGDAFALGFDNHSFDLIVSFKVIEHIKEAGEFAQNVARLLTPDGLAILSTPNRRVVSPNGGVSDPTHVREYSSDEFLDLLLKNGFGEVEMTGQFHGRDVWETHAVRASLGRSLPGGLKRLIPSRMKASIIRSIRSVQELFRPTPPDQSLKTGTDVETSHVLLALCRLPS